MDIRCENKLNYIYWKFSRFEQHTLTFLLTYKYIKALYSLYGGKGVNAYFKDIYI
jgi:hypothetical protein